MKVIKMINTNGLYCKGHIYCISNDSGTDTQQWVVDENGCVMHNIYLPAEDYVDVVGNPEMGGGVFYNSDLAMAMTNLEMAFRDGMVMGSTPTNYDQQQRDKEMENFFREMSSMMRMEQTDRYAQKNREMNEQQAKLDKEIKIIAHTDEAKLAYYLLRGIKAKMNISIKKVG